MGSTGVLDGERIRGHGAALQRGSERPHWHSQWYPSVVVSRIVHVPTERGRNFGLGCASALSGRVARPREKSISNAAAARLRGERRAPGVSARGRFGPGVLAPGVRAFGRFGPGRSAAETAESPGAKYFVWGPRACAGLRLRGRLYAAWRSVSRLPVSSANTLRTVVARRGSATMARTWAMA